MKAISVNGITKTGKTTVCECIISGLKKRGYSVGSVKEIHYDKFKIDTPETTNTNRHKKAGAQLVTARGFYETDILYQEKLSIKQILEHYDYDYVILEGVSDCNVPRILTGKNYDDIIIKMDPKAIAVSGVIANTETGEIEGLPIINCLKEADKLVDFVMDNAFEPLPDFDEHCCTACGYTCGELAAKIAHGEETYDKCVLNNQSVELSVNGKNIPMVPFVQRILKNSVVGVVSELEGYNSTQEIKVKIK